LDSTKNLGNLRVNRLLSKDRRKELLFYELTWSMITAKQKEVLAYDNFGQSPDRRADVNNMLKAFSKNTFSDIIIYLGESRVDILMSFAQSFCWMTKNWEDLPDNERQTCKGIDSTNENIKVDQYAFVTHSLGSRITIDGLTRIIALLSSYGRDVELSHSFKDKVFSIFILSNQLPMLQLGRELPEVSNQNSAYCQPESVKYSERAVSRMPIFTFSNPNDILSYPISPEFVEKYLDSRLCPEVVNININMASLYNTFGLGNIVNPLDANTGYYEDDRVVALIARGFGNANTSKVVQQQCHFSVEEK